MTPNMDFSPHHCSNSGLTKTILSIEIEEEETKIIQKINSTEDGTNNRREEIDRGINKREESNRKDKDIKDSNSKEGESNKSIEEINKEGEECAKISKGVNANITDSKDSKDRKKNTELISQEIPY